MDKDKLSEKKIRSKKGDRRTVAKEIIELLQQAANQKHEILPKDSLHHSSAEYHKTDQPSNSYAEQLQNDFGNVVIGAGKIHQESIITRRPAECESQNVKSSSEKCIENLQPTDKELAKKSKKHKNRSKGEKPTSVSFWSSLTGSCKEDLKLLAVLFHRIKFVLCWPFIFITTLTLTLSIACLSLLGSIFSTKRFKLTGFKKDEALSEPVQRNPKINTQEALDQNAQEPKMINDHEDRIICGSKNSGDNNEPSTENPRIKSVRERHCNQYRGISKDNQTPGKKFSPSLKILDELQMDDHPYNQFPNDSKYTKNYHRQCPSIAFHSGGKYSHRLAGQDEYVGHQSESSLNRRLKLKENSAIIGSGNLARSVESKKFPNNHVSSKSGREFSKGSQCQYSVLEGDQYTALECQSRDYDTTLGEDSPYTQDSEKNICPAFSSLHLRKRRYNRQSRDSMSRLAVVSSSDEDGFESQAHPRRLRSHSGTIKHKNQQAEDDFQFSVNSCRNKKQFSVPNIPPLHLNEDDVSEEYSRKECEAEFSDSVTECTLRNTHSIEFDVKSGEENINIHSVQEESSQKKSELENSRQFDEDVKVEFAKTPLRGQRETSKITNSPGKELAHSMLKVENKMRIPRLRGETEAYNTETLLKADSDIEIRQPQQNQRIGMHKSVEMQNENFTKIEERNRKHQFNVFGIDHRDSDLSQGTMHPSLIQIAEKLQQQQKEVAHQTQLLIQEQAKLIQQQQMQNCSTENTKICDPPFLVRNLIVKPEIESIPDLCNDEEFRSKITENETLRNVKSSEKHQIPVKDQEMQPTTGETMENGSGEMRRTNQSPPFETNTSGISETNFAKNCKHPLLSQSEENLNIHPAMQSTTAVVQGTQIQLAQHKEELPKPVDAKAKWLEIKRKFYGADYGKPEEEHKVNEEPASNSKPPAHKIFQYNMRVGRARQMGTEPPTFESVCTKDNKPMTGALGGSSLGLAMMAMMQPRSSAQITPPLQPTSAATASHCLLQTQSLLDWPSETDGSCDYQRKQLPVPKPRKEQEIRRKNRNINPRTVIAHRQSSGGFNSYPAACSTSNSNVKAYQEFSTSSFNGNHESGLPPRGQESLIQLSDEVDEEKDERDEKFQEEDEGERETRNPWDFVLHDKENCAVPKIVQHPKADHTAHFLPHSGINLRPDDQILLHGPGGQPARVQSAVHFFRSNNMEMQQRPEGSGPWVALSPTPPCSTQRHPHLINTCNSPNGLNSLI